jgi:hypothetical protein
MTDLSELVNDDDTGPIGTAARRKVENPAAETVALGVDIAAHDRADRWRFLAVAVWLTALTAGVTYLATHVQAEERESATTRAQLDDVRDRLVRIEAQIDRLMERSERE